MSERRFPLLPTYTRGRAIPSGTIPWNVAERAYAEYARRYGRSQSLERLAERGGFGVEEMDDLLPGWRSLFSGAPDAR